MRRTVTAVFAALGLLMLMLDSRTALQGAAQGLTLCLGTLVPSLLPFFFLSNLLCGTLSGASGPLLRPLERLCRIPRGSGAILATGLLAGYPVGAQQTAAAWQRGQLSRREAERMLGFSSNAGPAFLFGILGMKFHSPGPAWVLWLVHMASALAAAVLLPGGTTGSACIKARQSGVPEAMEKSVASMAKVCAWVILLRVVIAFLQRWCLWLLPGQVQIAFVGILELANGCCMLDGVACPGLRLMLASAFLALGGLCVGLQTLSVTGGLGLGRYFPGKLLQCMISLLLTGILQNFLFPPCDRVMLPGVFYIACVLFLAVFAGYLRYSEKNSSNSTAVRV